LSRRQASQIPWPSWTSTFNRGAAQAGEEIGVMGARLAEDLHHLGEERVHAGPHVERRNRQQ